MTRPCSQQHADPAPAATPARPRLVAVEDLTSESFLRALDSHIAPILADDDMPCLADWENAVSQSLKALTNPGKGQ